MKTIPERYSFSGSCQEFANIYFLQSEVSAKIIFSRENSSDISGLIVQNSEPIVIVSMETHNFQVYVFRVKHLNFSV